MEDGEEVNDMVKRHLRKAGRKIKEYAHRAKPFYERLRDKDVKGIDLLIIAMVLLGLAIGMQIGIWVGVLHISQTLVYVLAGTGIGIGIIDALKGPKRRRRR